MVCVFGPCKNKCTNVFRRFCIASHGVHTVRKLPDPGFAEYWDAIHLDDQIKKRLLNQAILNFTLRPHVSRALVPLHGIILLVGVPGTGKTSLAKGLADRVGQALKPKGITYLEVEPHALTSSSLGGSQKAVTELFGTTIREHAGHGPTFVLLDEVETLLVDRSKLSMQANPVDVHRATDAALVQLDHLANSFPDLLFVATSNFPQALDGAFSSRCDLILEIPPPNANAIRAILTSSVEQIAIKFPKVAKLVGTPDFEKAVEACKGLDGRQIRKAVASACSFDSKTALDPNLMTAHDLLHAVTAAKKNKL